MRRVILLAIALAGCGGAQGPAGPSGPSGKDGVNAYPNRLLGAAYCHGGNSVMSLRHNIWAYEGGEVVTSCEVGFVGGSFSGFAMYMPSQVGAETAGCPVGVDLDTASWGYMRFEVAGGRSVATYDDNGSPSDGHAWQLLCDNY